MRTHRSTQRTRSANNATGRRNTSCQRVRIYRKKNNNINKIITFNDLPALQGVKNFKVTFQQHPYLYLITGRFFNRLDHMEYFMEKRQYIVRTFKADGFKELMAYMMTPVGLTAKARTRNETLQFTTLREFSSLNLCKWAYCNYCFNDVDFAILTL